MIHLYYGDDRQKMNAAAQKVLDDNYETFSGDKLELKDLPNLFLGTSLFSEQRNILVRGLLESTARAEDLAEFLTTPHNIVLLETKFERRSAAAKKIAADSQVELREFKLPEPDTRAVFDIFSTALTNGPRSVELLDRLIDNQDPYRLLGLFATQAIKRYSGRPTPENTKILKSLAQLDVDLKTSPLSAQPWLLVKSWLLSLSQR